MARRLPLLVACAWAAVSSTHAPAHAFCRTKTCDPLKEDCEFEDGCNASGLSVRWLSACVEFSVQRSGSSRRGLTAEQAKTVIAEGFDAWMDAECPGGGSPSIAVTARDTFETLDDISFSIDGGNRNVWLFRDARWPYANSSHTLALSTVTLDLTHGRILDVDVEVNSADYDLTTSTDDVGIDFQSIATHEAGHFLGLDHSQVRAATMFANYTGGNVELRDLSEDDAEGICEIYPPDDPSDICEPDALLAAEQLDRNGASDGCGCRSGPNPSTSASAVAFMALAGAFARLRRTRRRNDSITSS